MNSFSTKRGYRSARIERAAAEILECDILPNLNDPLLENLRVFSVQLAGGLSCLHVLVAPNSADAKRDSEVIDAALSRVEGHVRAELAAVLRIKRMPSVRLRYVGICGEGQAGGTPALREGGEA